MRAIPIAALMTAGIGLAGTSPTLAVPANGTAIADAAVVNPMVEQVHWRRYYHRHWRWRHYHRRWW